MPTPLDTGTHTVMPTCILTLGPKPATVVGAHGPENMAIISGSAPRGTTSISRVDSSLSGQSSGSASSGVSAGRSEMGAVGNEERVCRFRF
jgi:hypothetical protein